MFQPNNQLPLQTIKDSSALMQVDQTEKSIVVRDEKQNGGFAHAETIIYYFKRLQDDLQMLGMKIKGHEDNIKFLNAQNIKLDDCILDLQGSTNDPKMMRMLNKPSLKLVQLEGMEEPLQSACQHELWLRSMLRFQWWMQEKGGGEGKA